MPRSARAPFMPPAPHGWCLRDCCPSSTSAAGKGSCSATCRTEPGGRGCLSDDGGRRSRRRAASTSRRAAVRRPRTRRGAGTQPSGARTCPNPTPRVTTVIARLGGSTSTSTRVFSRPPRISICSGTPENFRLAPARWPARRRRRGRRRTTRCRTGAFTRGRTGDQPWEAACVSQVDPPAGAVGPACSRSAAD